MFYLGSFAGAFAFGFPLGPSSLEMLRLTAAGRRVQALSLAAGVASADATWALAALAGLHPWLGIGRSDGKGLFFLLAASVCAFLAWRGGMKPFSQDVRGKREHGAAFWKGVLLGASYPLTFGSWMVALTVMRGFGWGIPAGMHWLSLFFAVVFLGYFVYLALLHFLFTSLSCRLEPGGDGWLRRLPRRLLLFLAGFFLVLAAVNFLFGR
jgi:threonine/homoserine/homoserine lactone efflux protein